MQVQFKALSLKDLVVPLSEAVRAMLVVIDHLRIYDDCPPDTDNEARIWEANDTWQPLGNKQKPLLELCTSQLLKQKLLFSYQQLTSSHGQPNETLPSLAASILLSPTPPTSSLLLPFLFTIHKFFLLVVSLPTTNDIPLSLLFFSARRFSLPIVFRFSTDLFSPVNFYPSPHLNLTICFHLITKYCIRWHRI